MPPPVQVPAVPVWKTCLDIEGQEGGHYHDYVNTNLLDLVDGTPRRALDLGCSTGAFGQALKQRHAGLAVTGIEPGRAASVIAAGRLDRVINARLEDVHFDDGLGGPFDLAIAADVLEHLQNPWDALVRLRAILAPGAQVLASVPNVRNLAVILDLLGNGTWDYQERGILDITHLRFFTFSDIQRMLEQTGYRIEAFTGNVSPRLAEHYRQHKADASSTFQIDRFRFSDLTPREVAELHTEQFLLRVRAA